MAIAKDSKVIMSSEQFVSRLKVLAGRNTYYKNKYPDNLCYIHADGRTSADCVNLVKALLNGYNVYNLTPGYFQRDLSNTGDCTEAELLCQCSDVTSDFAHMGNRPRVLYMKGHIGVYLGEEVVRSGCVYNVIECTSSKVIGNGICYSYVDSDGTRRKTLNGEKCGKWTQNGLPDRWVSFNETEAPNLNEKPKVNINNYPVLKKGARGEYVKILQTLLLKKGYDPKGVDGIWGPNTNQMVLKFQRENSDIYGKRLAVDGCVGPLTWGALYK